MKEQILKALKIKFSNLGFGDKAFEGVAAYLATTVTEEDKIETAIGGVEPLLKSFQGDADKRVNDAIAKEKKEKSTDKGDESKKDKQENKSSDDGKSDDVPAWAKSLIEQNKTLQEKIQGIESVKTLESRKSVLEKKLEGLPEKVKTKFVKDFNRMSFSNDDEFNTFLTETESDIAEIKQDISNHNVKAFGKPILAGGKTEKEPPKEEVKSIVGDLMKN